MAFEKICTLDDVWEGDMDAFETLNGTQVLVLGVDGGDLKAFQAVCPHQEIDLVEGEFDGKVLTCKAHLWQFDVSSGKGLNPTDCQIAEYPVKIEGEDVLVDVKGIEPFTAHS
ncbi:MAG: Rieske 2Fe-2S domain-containing protein [Cycloclasticus sp.]|jgi:toluene monooxygenase system ferredoxin subunit|nr:Rieske 2Fe-2S domain-containing protein [Cycloclasticus sp.]|tara:strand:- start:310 stop:648 length:339 start_codon:yes stop_codon:yes gene_type:complete